jgi:YjbE family integral membrane protein
MESFIHFSALSALLQVIMIDLLLAADNTIVVGLVASGLPVAQRKKVVFIGVMAATFLRVIFALVVSYLLAIVGLLLAGGMLLAWVAWKMWRELRRTHEEYELSGTPPKTFREAVTQIIVADIAMSLDNVLAVAGAAREHIWVLIFGLTFSMFLMALASTWLANFLQRYRWLAYVGLLIVLYVSIDMMWKGGHDIINSLELNMRH